MTTLADEGVEQVTHLRAQWVGQWEKDDDFDGALESSQELPAGDRRREAAAGAEIPAGEGAGGEEVGLHQEQTRREHRHGRPPAAVPKQAVGGGHQSSRRLHEALQDSTTRVVTYTAQVPIERWSTSLRESRRPREVSSSSVVRER